MNNDSEQSAMQFLRNGIKELADACEDADLLDLIYKLLLQG